MPTCCNTFQLLVPIAQTPFQAYTSRTGEADSMEATDSSRLVESKDMAMLNLNGMGSMWVFQRQPAVTSDRDVRLLDDPSARWRLIMGDIPQGS